VVLCWTFNMRVLVTGASGFIGLHVARHLANMGHEVLAQGRDPNRLSRAEQAGCKIQNLDLARDDLKDLVKGRTAIIHCAAKAAPWGRAQEFYKDNVLATDRLLSAADASESVSRFVHFSSPSIYFRFSDQGNIDEAFLPPLRWPNHYARTKWESECSVRRYPGLNPIILRPRAVFGPGDRAIVPRLIAVAERGFFPLPAQGRAWTDVTYVGNVVTAVVAALHAPNTLAGRAFNITNNEPIQVSDLLARLFEALGVKARMVPIPRGLLLGLASGNEWFNAHFRPGSEPRITLYGAGLLSFSQTLSIAAAQKDLAYAPAISLSEGLARFASWWRSR
jgi:nucleoside-diphosphate-sugar epimerase